MSCVVTSTKEFKDAQKKYNLSEDNLRDIVYEYQNRDGFQDSFPNEDYIREKVLGKSMTDATKEQIEIWKKYFSKPFVVDSIEEQNKLYSKALEYFNEKSVVKSNTLDGKYRVSVAVPYTKEYTKEIKEILKNASRDSQGRLLAPNGKPSNLTEKQYAQVRTKAFINWFGDWINDPENASKVVDENGEPLVVYHGSPNKNIEIFNTKEATGLKLKKLEDLSISKTSWFTEERIARETYSIVPESFGTGQPEYGKTYPVFLNIKNPVSDGLKNAEEIQEFWGTYVKSDETIRDLMQRVHNNITENTDGFILRFEDRDLDAPNYMSLQTQYGIVDPNQAKSATDNMGTFKTEGEDKDNFYHEQIVENKAYKYHDSNLNSLFNTHIDKTNNIFEASVPIIDIINILSSSEYSNIIALLQSIDTNIFKDIKVQLVSTALSNRRYEGRLGTENKRAYYDAAEKTIYINVDGNYVNGNASSVIMHEILHAITVDKILSNPDRKQTFIDIMNQYNAYVNNLDRRYIKSPIESKDQTVEEFVANIWSDPKTIEVLKEIKVDNSDLTLWDKIKQFFTDLFAGIFEGTTEDSLMAKASEEMIRLLESPTTTESTEKFNESIKDNNTKFTTSKTSSYAKRTRDNANWSDITLALATDFNTAGEKLTKTAAGDKYVSSNINDSVDKIVSSILKQINRKGLPVKNIKLNVAGNGIYSLKNFSQEKVNNLVTEVIKGLQKAGITISEIRSGGQTGVDEAGIIAAQRLNIPNSVHTTSDWKFRDSSGKDISDETAFRERFSIKENKDEATINLEVLDKSKAIIEEIIADSEENIKKHKNFDKEDVEGSHTYLIRIDDKWIPADYSVTQLISGNIDLGDWKLPSTKIGNTTDKFVRDYFQLESSKRKNIIRRSYPNLTMEHKKDFFTQMQKLEAYFDSIYGKGHYRVETREFPISGRYYYDEDGTTKYYNIAGTMDMIVYDDKGNIDIYDVKTARSGIDKSKQEKYTKQLSIYKAILEANYPELRGKIRNLSLIRFDVKYPKPSDVLYTTMDTDKDTLYISEDSDLEFKELKYYDSDIYDSPKLKSDYIIPLSPYSYEDEIKSLTEEERTLVEEEMEKEEKKTFETPKNNLYNNPLLTASERRFLADNVMNYVSFIVSNLQSDSESNSYYFDSKYSQYDFTSMSRNEILNIPGALYDIFYYIKEAYYNPDNRDDIEDFDILDKLQVAYDNWEELVKSGYSRLITLEGVTVYDVLPEDIKTELTDVDSDYNLDSANLEEKEREYWQIGIRNISAKASLSKDIRRLFEKLEIVDSNGESVLDSFGFGFKTFVNSDEAVNSILSWCSDCTNMEEMEKMLQTYEENHPWLTPILEKIKEEPIRSQFFQNFRKDFTQYSIVLTETDGKGNTVYKTLVINTKGASKVILEGVTNAYTLGLLTDIIKPIKGDIEGRGSVNVSKVKTLSDSISDIDSKLSEAFKNRTITRTINSIVKELASILNALGVQVDSKTLKDAFALDKNKKNYNASNVYTIINNLKYLTDTLLEAKNESAYNPIIKGEKYNVYGNYKNIINTLSKYIQDSIESSSYENGKMHYSFVTPSYMGKLVTNLKNAISDPNKFEKFITEEYKSYKWFYSEGKWLNDWLKQLATQSDARQDFDHKVQLAFDDVPYTELSELNYALSLIHEYFYDKNGKLAWYRVPILANKPSSEFIRFRRYTGKNYQKDIKRKLGNVLTQEMSRIKTVLERSYNPNVNKIGVKEKVTYDIVDSMILNSKGKLDTNLIRRIKKGELTIKDFIVNGKLRFENSGASFKFLPALNNEFLNETELAQLIVDKINGKEVNEERLTKLFNDAIDAYMAMIVSKELNYYESLGMFDIEKKKDKSSFKYLNQLGNSIEEIKGNLTEYIWNDMFATINIVQLTATDLAYYKNVEEFQKRYSQVHAPTLKFNTTAVDSKGIKYSADAKTRTIYIKDSIVVSEIISNVTKIFEDKIKTLSGAEKEHMKMMKDLIISSFEDINVADAQAYSSPTSYRKKMGMQGKWTTEMEKAYERIKSGNYNVNDLGVVWQPLKPFVYSQIRKSSGASTMSEIKVPVQNKNSEYLLILADALMRSGNQVSKLTAIFDFMEESAYDGRVHKDGKVISEGVYNGKGIDTIQFESAVNSGSMGAIDINGLSSYEDIKQALHEAVYYNSDKSESSDNNDDRYNDQYVHTISFEDYGIQQEVPAHFIDHEQLMGSQIRILSISDITPGTKFTVRGESIEDKQLIQEYQELHAQNIRESFKDLVDEFNIKGTKLQKNKALERILQDAILKDQRYGADLLRACTLNEQGEFTIPLYDPIQSIRIQQLINSIIKSRINKQKILGGPVVQTSVFGMSDDLKIVWEDKDKGIVKHFECYMPIPSKKLEEIMTRYDANGNAYFISLDEAVKQGIVPEEMRKAIGYRIPTEDKYSMVPLYIKGFLPKAAGESIMLPKEITKLSGSDFDIKLFIGVIKLC